MVKKGVVMNLILQPCANYIAQQHYNDTVINNNLVLEDIRSELMESDYEALLNIYGSNNIHIWGVTKSSYTKWEKIQIGNIVLFSKNKEIFSHGVVCYKIHNKQLANILWGKNADGLTWEYIYFLAEVNSITISYKDFNKTVGYADNYVIQGLSVLNQEKTEKFLNVYPLQSKDFLPIIKEEEYIECINNSLIHMESVDEKILTNQRKEQNFLRQQLFKGKTKAKCAICGKEYPVSFLCCSHIKKRCDCSLEEKKDYKNIVVPMCEFGCDKLYENGLISVENGIVKVLKFTGLKSVDDYLQLIEGNNVIGYNEFNKKYFDEHLKKNS